MGKRTSLLTPLINHNSHTLIKYASCIQNEGMLIKYLVISYYTPNISLKKWNYWFKVILHKHEDITWCSQSVSNCNICRHAPFITCHCPDVPPSHIAGQRSRSQPLYCHLCWSYSQGLANRMFWLGVAATVEQCQNDFVFHYFTFSTS
jgi:hypothetical protein